MFGIELSPSALELLNEVETLYGERVWENGPIYLDPREEGAAGLSPDGAPCIRLRAGTVPTEELIVHELFHLKLSATGFPYIFTAAPLSQESLANIHFFVAELYDAIEHWIIYPPMRAMGLQPDIRLRRDMELAMRYGYRYGERPRRAVQTLYHFMGTLLSDDVDLVARFTHWYECSGWGDALATSRKLVEKIITDRPVTPTAAVSTLVSCLNLLELGGVFRAHSTETHKCGRKNVQVVYLEYVSGEF